MLVALSLAACSGPYVAQYEDGVATNYANIAKVRLGMTRAELDDVMGHREIVRYKRVVLNNPQRTESFRVRPDLLVDIVYYVTQGYVWQGPDDSHALTPVILENGIVVGWGWGFLGRNRDRYVIEGVPPRP